MTAPAKLAPFEPIIDARLERYPELFESRAMPQRDLFQFIEIWYNRQRRHSSPGYRSPAQFEAERKNVS